MITTFRAFATGVTRAKNVTNETGFIRDHFTKKLLPRHIKCSTGEIYRLRRFSSILRIHSSSKKDGVEEFFAELQLFSPWRTDVLDQRKEDEETWESHFIDYCSSL